MINTSFFELFKIGPGPSSSHTVGPMRAAFEFRQTITNYLQNCSSDKHISLRIALYGALAATGHGHGTHRALLAGLLGYLPTNVPITALNNFFTATDESYCLLLDEQKITFVESDIYFDYGHNPYRHPNTMKFVLLQDYVPVLEQVFYSVGGGFIETDKDEAATLMITKGTPTYIYSNMADLQQLQQESGVSVDVILLANEMAISLMTEQEVFARIADILEIMEQSVVNGLQKEGILPGGLQVHRRAKSMYEKAQHLTEQGRWGDALFARLNAYALATSEENAAGQMVVTAPTNGAAGVIPATIAYLENDCHVGRETISRGLLVAAMVGFIIKDNASISGAELGCQAEVGSAAAMAAALFSFCYGEPLDVIASAAEIAMEHHLGMTCDPIKGLVQIPCIERNATGAVKAYNAYLLASGRTTQPLISFDQVVEVMRQTGLDLSAKYKETALGGLATSFGWGNMPGS